MSFILNNCEKEILIQLARQSIKKKLKVDEEASIPYLENSDVLNQKLGAFVSIYIDKKLRGCIGRFSSPTPLVETIGELAISAAFTDDRFLPVSANELKGLNIEISILTPLIPINSPDEIELGKHGIYIKQGFHSGTFLPQVAEKTGWTKEEFLGHCSRDKAHIGWDGWKRAELFIYEAIIFSGS